MRWRHSVRGVYKRILPKNHRVCLYYWKPVFGSNFGDELSLDIVSALLRKVGSSNPASIRRCDDRRRTGHRLFAVGSILHQCRPGDTVWGSGINGKMSTSGYDFDGVDIRAVRGPLTRRMIINKGGDCPEVYGDPGLLIPRLFPELSQPTTSPLDIDVSVILNVNDLALISEDSGHAPPANLISPNMSWRRVATEIRRSKFVVSSSLHGIILADAFGVPCRPLIGLFESLFKFQDYFLSTARDGVAYARSVDEALRLGAIPPPSIDLEGLLDAFPIDIWSLKEQSS